MKPNWKEPKDYPIPKVTSLDRWAAEFLMRNEKFISELKAAESKPNPSAHQDGRPIGWSSKPVGKVLKDWGVNLPMLPEWVQAGISDSYFVFEKFPRFIPMFKVEKAGGVFLPEAVGKYFNITPNDPNRLALEFDLSAPIQPQLERAKSMLLANQKQRTGGGIITKRAIVDKYPWYLRILDARWAGATDPEIIRIFNKQSHKTVNAKTLENWENAACEMRDGGYRALVTAPPIRKKSRPK